ncbi:MAG: hypothetical protein HOC23_18015 [Halieaceae bacterium]|nr:hypothetical protein [Halieaceae bacterium]
MPKILGICTIILVLVGCSTDPMIKSESVPGRIVCDSYLVLDMCVRDFVGDGVVDMIYFSDTNEVFMYRDDMKQQVGQVMPFHRCAVPLSDRMQQTTDRILKREDMSLTEEVGIAKNLIASYVAAKPQIDACNARFEEGDGASQEPKQEFFMEESGWEEG